MWNKRRFAAFVFAALGTSAFGQDAVVKPPGIERVPLVIDLPHFRAKAEMTLPAGAGKPLPAVLLIHGSDVADMDYTMADDHGKISSHILLDIAEALSARGFAVVRYNKRYVDRYDKYDAERFAQLTLQDLLADARTALAVMRDDPRVDRNNVFVYGWSEGSAIAGQIALTDPGLRGVIFQGAVARPFSENLGGLFNRTGLPYLAGFARDGKIGAKELAAALAGNGGVPAKMFTRFLVSRDSAPGTPKVTAMMDKDGDGLIDLEREAKPTINGWFGDDSLGIYSDARALPGLVSIAPRLTLPVLILQGANDGNAPAEGAQALLGALPPRADHTLKVYPGLGHSLGPAPTIMEDAFAPIDEKPLRDAADWLTSHVGNHPGNAAVHPPADGAPGR